jgi:hypothetical protein
MRMNDEERQIILYKYQMHTFSAVAIALDSLIAVFSFDCIYLSASNCVAEIHLDSMFGKFGSL